MLVLITYDVNTEDAAGRRRLRQIAKQCVKKYENKIEHFGCKQTYLPEETLMI